MNITITDDINKKTVGEHNEKVDCQAAKQKRIKRSKKRRKREEKVKQPEIENKSIIIDLEEHNDNEKKITENTNNKIEHPEIENLLEYFPGFIISHSYHILYDSPPPQLFFDRQKMAIRKLTSILVDRKIIFSPIIKCPADQFFPYLDGLPDMNERISWNSKDLNEIMLRWPDRLITQFLAIFDFDYDLAQHNNKSEELKRLYEQFYSIVKKLLS